MAHLLLIDDDPDLLPDQVRQVFPAPAHGVEIAHTGREGLERALDGRPDVILLDLRLPDQSGLDVLRQLRQIDARIPVVLVTVVRSADSAIEAMGQGAYDYLLKPLDLQKLDRVLSEALKVARLMREPAGLALSLTVTALWRLPTRSELCIDVVVKTVLFAVPGRRPLPQHGPRVLGNGSGRQFGHNCEPVQR